jgi:uncharacterized protein (TIGR03663 family)
MTRGCGSALFVIALAVSLPLRFARLDVRPMHHDEANQAVKFGTLLERGEYRYDAHDHHGPTLYYLTLPAAWLRGQATFASLDEWTLRGVTAVFGVATILLLPLLSSAIGRTAVAVSAILMAISPAMVFFSRMFIQESLFACFTLAFVIAIGRVLTGGGLASSAIAGVAAGLAIATKETAVIVLPSAVAACAIARALSGGGPLAPPDSDNRGGWGSALPAIALTGLLSAIAVAAIFYSSFFANPAGLIEPLRGASTYLDRGIAPVSHAHPWHYYIQLLTYSKSGLWWSEGLIVVLAVVGGLTAWRGGFWTRYLTCYVVITTVIFSAIPYKTPWNLLPFYAGAIVLAGIGFSRLISTIPSRGLLAVIVTVCLVGALHLGRQAWRAAVTYSSDSRTPYVYAQTVPDAVRMATRIRELAALHPAAEHMQVSVIASPYEQWPLPWYLRTMPNVGYWTVAGDPVAMRAPVIVASTDFTGALESLGDRYVSEFFGLRPEVPLALYVDRGLWEQFLARQAGTSNCLGEHCGPAFTMALWRTANAQ